MNRLAGLLERLAYEPRRNAKVALIASYFKATPDPERGYALAALTGSLTFREAKPAMIRKLIGERTDPVLFALSYDYVGDLSETVALLWPAAAASDHDPISLTEVVTALASAKRGDVEALVAGWLDHLDEKGRFALLKLITSGLRVGISSRLALTALAALGDQDVDTLAEIWLGQEPPYEAVFSFAEGRGPRPETAIQAVFLPPMLAHALEEADHALITPDAFAAEWKWDGIRVQVSVADGQQRLYSRTGDDISTAFPDLAHLSAQEIILDGELLILRNGKVMPFSDLQQRLNRKTVTPKLLAEFPVQICAYDLLRLNGEDLRALPTTERRKRLEAWMAAHPNPRLSLSPLVPFESFESLATIRSDPGRIGVDPDTVEGMMLKRLDSPYLAGRPKGHWFKWKRDPRVIDAVLMYAQRGHGKRSSFYSDFTFGVWREGATGPELTPVGKAYFGFTDAELLELDKYVRRNTVDRHGPVRVVRATRETGLVLEIAFEGLNRSTRHKSGVAMRFPRISRIRWDKPTAEADVLATLQAMLTSEAVVSG
jgi:DNA ligase 1